MRPAAALALLAACGPALAQETPKPINGCPVERAVYRDMEGVATLAFIPGSETAAVTNGFKLELDNDVVLDGIVMWTEGVRRPNGMLGYRCPEGDVTGEELAACTAWQGVIYTADGTGNIQLLPPEGADAPARLVLADLGHSLRYSAAWGANGFSQVPWDVFELVDCR